LGKATVKAKRNKAQYTRETFILKNKKELKKHTEEIDRTWNNNEQK